MSHIFSWFTMLLFLIVIGMIGFITFMFLALKLLVQVIWDRYRALDSGNPAIIDAALCAALVLVIGWWLA